MQKPTKDYSKITRTRLANGKSSSNNAILFEYPTIGDINPQLGSITITRNDLSRLNPESFLNDTLISFFMQHELDSNVRGNLKNKIHIFESFFFSKIKSLRTSKNESAAILKSVSRWLKGVRIFDKDFLIMPICENDHWTLAIICYHDRAPAPAIKLRTIPDECLYEPAVFVLNSFSPHGPSIKKSLSMFLTHRWSEERKTPRSFKINHVKRNGIRLIFPDMPQQRNSYNCGVYVLNYFNCFLKGPREAYLRMFRRRDLREWFHEHGISIVNERKRMRAIIQEQTQIWNSDDETAKRTARQSEQAKTDSCPGDDLSIRHVESGSNSSIIMIN